MGALIIWLVIMVPVSALLTGLGIFAWKRQKPMWFWSGQTIGEDEIDDVKAYNRANGIMWIVFSLLMWFSTFLAFSSMRLAGMVMLVGCIICVPVLPFVYSRIYKRYKKHERSDLAVLNMGWDNIEWLFFDVGSTLVSEEKPFLHRLHEIAEAVNEPFETIQDKVLQLYKENKKGEAVLIQENGIERPRWRSEDEELFPESYECLEQLSKKYKIGVIANQKPGTAARLEKHGVLKFIDLVIASAEEGLEKPDRRIFELALSRAKCKPENAVMIGDRVDNDIIPAKKLGMKTVRVKQGMWKYWEPLSEDEKADYEVDDLSAVLALFK